MQPPRLAGSLAGLLVAALLAPPARAQLVTVDQDLVYASGVPTAQGPVDLVVDLYRPTGASAPLPVILYIHGGGWSQGTENGGPGYGLALLGYASASVRYRLSGQATWPAQLHDVKGAVRWLRANAQAYGLDPDRFGALGGSAGGHLAAILGTTGDVGAVALGGVEVDLEGTVGGNLAHSSRVQCAVDQFGSTDFLAVTSAPSSVLHEGPASAEGALLGAPPLDVPMLAASADPGRWLSRDDPPLLLLHGTHDLIIPYAQTEQLHRRAALGFGLDAGFLPVVDGVHGFTSFESEAPLAFFDEHLRGGPDVLVSVAAQGALGEGGRGRGGVFTIARTGPTGQPLTVRLAIGGTATEGEDVEPLGLAVVIPAGLASFGLAPRVLDDALVEGDEVLELALAPSPAYRVAADAASARLALFDDESPAGLPVVTAAAVDASATEGGDTARFTITRSGPTGAPLQVRYRLRGTAREGVDYAGLSGLVQLSAGAPSSDVLVLALDDAHAEHAETVVLELEAGATYVRGAPAGAAAVLRDDEPAQPRVQLALETDAVENGPVDGGAEGALLLTRNEWSGPLSVALSVTGSAAAGADYAPLPLQVDFPADEPFRHVVVDALDDGALEGVEEVVVRVLAGAGYLPGPEDERAVRIADDEAAYPPAQVALEVGPVLRGELVSATVVGEPDRPWQLLVSVGAGYHPQASGHPLLLDTATYAQVVQGRLDRTGRATFHGALPFATLPDEVRLQARVLDGASWRYSELRVRRTLEW